MSVFYFDWFGIKNKIFSVYLKCFHAQELGKIFNPNFVKNFDL